jgi:hypothetical protein
MSQLENGYILLSRSLENSMVFQNEKWLKVWIWCLLQANHTTTQLPVKTGRGESVVTLQRGQFIFGRNSASKKLKMAPSTVRNIVYKLATWQNLDIKEDSHYSIITIRNYEIYQTPENYKRTGKRTGKGQAKDTDNNDNNEKNKICDLQSPSLPQKKNKLKDNRKDPRIKDLIDYFHTLVVTEKGFKPIIDASDATAVKRALESMSEEEVKNAILFYIDSPKAKEHGPTLSIALSKHSINLYMEKGKWLYDG